MKSLALVCLSVLAFGCKDNSPADNKTELECSWQVMESYPEQVSGECTLDTNKDSLEIPLAENFTPLAATFVVELNGKVLDAAMYKLEPEKKLVTISPLSTDLKKGTAKIRYTADTAKPTLATVTKAHINTCTYLLVLENGQKLEPLVLPQDFQTDGLKVSVIYREQLGMASTCQAGTIVEVVHITKQ